VAQSIAAASEWITLNEQLNFDHSSPLGLAQAFKRSRFGEEGKLEMQKMISVNNL
jgi:hypothetical protein